MPRRGDLAQWPGNLNTSDGCSLRLRILRRRPATASTEGAVSRRIAVWRSSRARPARRALSSTKSRVAASRLVAAGSLYLGASTGWGVPGTRRGCRRCQSVAEADRQHERRDTGHVGRRKDLRLLEEVGDPVLVQTRRGTGARGDQHVVPLVERLHCGHDAALLAARVQVVRRVVEAGRQDASEEVASEIARPRPEVVVVDGEQFAARDDKLGVEHPAQRPRAAVFHRGAPLPEHADRVFHRPRQVGMRRRILFPVVTQHADPQPPDAIVERRAVVRHVARDAACVQRVEAGHGLQQDRAVFHGARHRSAVI